MLVDPARDKNGLRLYLPLFIAEAVKSNQPMLARREKLRQEGKQIGKRIGDLTRPPVPPAFEMWFVHLCEIDARLGVATASELGMSEEEIDGVCALRQAREEFWNKNSRCGKCGTVQEKSNIIPCIGCGHREGGVQ